MTPAAGYYENRIKAEPSTAAFVEADRTFTDAFEQMLFTTRFHQYDESAEACRSTIAGDASHLAEKPCAAIVAGGTPVIARRVSSRPSIQGIHLQS